MLSVTPVTSCDDCKSHKLIKFVNVLILEITEDPKKRMSVLNHHFVRHPAKIFEESPEAFTELTGVQQFPFERDSCMTICSVCVSDLFVILSCSFSADIPLNTYCFLVCVTHYFIVDLLLHKLLY